MNNNETEFRNRTWKIPEWNPGYIAMGIRYSFITPGDMEALPHYREAVAKAIVDGSAEKVEDHGKRAKDLSGLLPKHVAFKQRAWERRREAAYRWMVGGTTFRQIGIEMGISATAARNLCMRRNHRIAKGQERSPAETYCEEIQKALQAQE